MFESPPVKSKLGFANAMRQLDDEDADRRVANALNPSIMLHRRSG
jgi:hypothetical protein